MRHALKVILIASAILLTAGQIGFWVLLRAPLYEADNKVGYWPAPNQTGSYMLRNSFAFNNLGMGVFEAFKATDAADVLLVGDSIVYRGNEVPQHEKLGPLLETQTGWEVWPIAAGSWALQNELAYLGRIDEAVEQVDAIVFVFNSEDFGPPSSWQSEYTHPRDRVQFWPVYIAAKLWPREAPPPPPELRVKPRNVEVDWRAFRAGVEVPVVVVGVPKKTERDCSWMPAWIGPFTCVPMRPADYDDGIHPSFSGRERINATIQSALQ